MSRSFRRTSICGFTTARSEKDDKRQINKALRRRCNQLLAAGEEMMPERNEISTTWDFAKDGKQFFDEREWPKGMRK